MEGREIIWESGRGQQILMFTYYLLVGTKKALWARALFKRRKWRLFNYELNHFLEIVGAYLQEVNA
jgi:hypothetical protein